MMDIQIKVSDFSQITRGDLYDLVNEKGLSDNQIAEHFGISKKEVNNKRIQMKVFNKENIFKSIHQLPPDYLIQLLQLNAVRTSLPLFEAGDCLVTGNRSWPNNPIA